MFPIFGASSQLAHIRATTIVANSQKLQNIVLKTAPMALNLQKTGSFEFPYLPIVNYFSTLTV